MDEGRIQDLWGERTPYGPDDPWPVRVDQQLAEGVRDEDVEAWVPSASLLHSNGDAMDIAVAGGRIAGVRGRAGDAPAGDRDVHGVAVGVQQRRARHPGLDEIGRAHV